jgi:hypothetical protein
MSDRDRDLAQFFIDRPAEQPPTLLELVEQYRDMHLHGRSLDAADSMAEIERRLTAVADFHGTEATRIQAILATGDDKAWWQK